MAASRDLQAGYLTGLASGDGRRPVLRQIPKKPRRSFKRGPAQSAALRSAGKAEIMPGDHSQKAWRGDRCCCPGVAVRAQKRVCGWAGPALMEHAEAQSCVLRQPVTQDGMVRGEPKGVITLPEVKPTSQAESIRGVIDHLKITGPELFPSAPSSGSDAWRYLTPAAKLEEPQTSESMRSALPILALTSLRWSRYQLAQNSHRLPVECDPPGECVAIARLSPFPPDRPEDTFGLVTDVDPMRRRACPRALR